MVKYIQYESVLWYVQKYNKHLQKNILDSNLENTMEMYLHMSGWKNFMYHALVWWQDRVQII